MLRSEPQVRVSKHETCEWESSFETRAMRALLSMRVEAR
jgi:hypothetical protein